MLMTVLQTVYLFIRMNIYTVWPAFSTLSMPRNKKEASHEKKEAAFFHERPAFFAAEPSGENV